MTKALYSAAFLLGAAVILWMAAGFVSTDLLALMVTVIIGVVYVIGAVEQWQFRQVTNSLNQALANIHNPVTSLSHWLQQVHPSLQNAVRLRIEGERLPLPGPVLTPYLVGLLVMLGLLGTFIGMVVTLKGAVLALEGTTELQAIRAGLARPIEGLGLAFGTSVAGVAASAMLGLISTLNRRDRMLATRLLDSKVGNELKDFSLVHHRQETFKALQYQAQALPDVAEKLGTMATRIESMGTDISQALLKNQQEFQDAVTAQYQKLADSVESSLKESLASSSKEASEQVAPVIEAAMAQLGDQAKATRQDLLSSLQDQIAVISQSLEATSDKVAGAWQAGIETQQTGHKDLLDNLGQQMKHYESGLRDQTRELMTGFEQRFTDWISAQESEDKQRTAHWESLQSSWLTSFKESSQELSTGLANAWQNATAEGIEYQQQVVKSLEEASLRLTDSAQHSGAAVLEKISGLLHSTEALVESRQVAEQQVTENIRTQAQALISNTTAELEKLRDAENQRGQAAVDRIAALEEKVATHLANLGQALEDPMTRLIETASEAPKAAAEVIEQLRGEISKNVEKDNSLLEERTRMMEELNKLLASLEETSRSQRDAVEQLITHSSSTLEQVSQQFTSNVSSESDRLTEVADQFVGSVAEIASLGESFNEAVGQFSDANQNLIENLVRIEAAMEQAGNRSDEQLAYYVAQAREIIDHNIMSQKEIFEQLRQMNPQEELIPSEVS